MVNVEQQMTDEDLMRAVKPLLHRDEWRFFYELIRRWQAVQIKRALNSSVPHEIYRTQGQASAYDAILTRTREIKSM